MLETGTKGEFSQSASMLYMLVAAKQAQSSIEMLRMNISLQSCTDLQQPGLQEHFRNAVRLADEEEVLAWLGMHMPSSCRITP